MDDRVRDGESEGWVSEWVGLVMGQVGVSERVG